MQQAGVAPTSCNSDVLLWRHVASSNLRWESIIWNKFSLRILSALANVFLLDLSLLFARRVQVFMIPRDRLGRGYN